METEISGQYSVRAVTRALDLLVELSTRDQPAGLTELARSVGLHPTTCLRLLESLRSRGFAQQADDRGYLIGSRAFEVGNAFLQNFAIWPKAKQLAEDLAARTRGTSSVGVLDDGQVLYIAIACGHQREHEEVGIASTAGTRHPAYCTSLGKAILAELPAQIVARILSQHPPVRASTNTIVDAVAFQHELAAIRTQGYAVDNEERTPGVVCIGAAVRDHRRRPLGAISISGPAGRLRDIGLATLGSAVRETARSVVA